MARHTRGSVSASFVDHIDGHGESLLRLAWAMAAQSMGSVYYSLPLPSGVLPGDRPWPERWEQIRGSFDFPGRRVLELGSNMGLLSVFALLEGAEAAIAADRDRTVLRAGQVAASALGVFPTYVHCDFAYTDGWEELLLRHSPDVVCMFSVLRWVDDQQRLLRFCANFSEILVEDHASFDVASRRFHDIGFDDVRLTGHSEIGRPLLVARKGPGPKT